MIQSMTGFGAARRESGVGAIAIDVKTVNHKYLDVHVRLPLEYQSLEGPIRKAVGRQLRRGRVDVSVSISHSRKAVRIDADSELIGAYVDLMKTLQRQFPISGDLTVDAIARIPGAISVANSSASPEEEQQLLDEVDRTVAEALKQLVSMRRREGDALKEDLGARIGQIRGHLDQIRSGAAGLVGHYRERLVARLAELGPGVQIDSGRLEVEALIYADKSDITEEMTRLGSHLDQFDGVLASDDEAGKRLDFLLQEMNREATTILSKTSGLNQSGAAVGAAAIEIKVEIDKLREQVQNVE
jgi:uncharacterized protein (TIGR00255 family)